MKAETAGFFRLPLALVVVVGVLVPGCVLMNTASKPIYPEAASGTGASTVVFENQVPGSPFSMRAGIGIELALDGYSPTKEQYLPEGVTVLSVLPGSHTIRLKPTLFGNTPYYFQEVSFSFEVVAGKTYTVMFHSGGSAMKPGFTMDYDGWQRETTRQWPSEVTIANPLFG